MNNSISDMPILKVNNNAVSSVSNNRLRSIKLTMQKSGQGEGNGSF